LGNVAQCGVVTFLQPAGVAAAKGFGLEGQAFHGNLGLQFGLLGSGIQRFAAPH